MKMEYRKFGKTEENVFVLGLGTYGHGAAYGGITKEESFMVFSSIMAELPKDAKLLVDTAPRYGNGQVEEWVGQFIQELGKYKFLIATKGGRHIEPGRVNEKDFCADFLRYDLDKSLERLGLNEIFLYQLHNPSLDIIKDGSVFDILEQFRKEGKIKYYGISINDPGEGLAAINICKEKGYSGLASIQVIYNLLNKDAQKQLFKRAKEENIAIIAREPLLRGFLTGKYVLDNDFSNASEAVRKEIKIYGRESILSKVEEVRQLVEEMKCNIPLTQVAIKFALSDPYVTLAIPGINRIEYVDQDLGAAEMHLDESLLSKLREVKDLVEQ